MCGGLFLDGPADGPYASCVFGGCREVATALPFSLIPLALASGLVLGQSWPLVFGLVVAGAIAVRRQSWWLALLVLVGVAGGHVLAHQAAVIVRTDGQDTTLVARVRESPAVNASSSVVLERVSGRSVKTLAVELWLRLPDGVQSGERVEVFCRPVAVTERLGVLTRSAMRLRCDLPQVVSRRAPGLGRVMLERIRRRFTDGLTQALPSPTAELALGLTLGERSQLPPEITEAFRRSGTTHILALSGYNVSVLAGILLAVLPGLVGRRLALVTVSFSLLGFLLMTGAPASLVRATVMAWLLVAAQLLRRRVSAGRLLALAVSAILLFQPAQAFDLGFQLSVAATAGLIWSGGRETLHGVRAAVRATLAATVFTLPLLVVAFGRVSLVSPLANLVVLPVVPILFLGCLGFGVVASLVPAVALAVNAPLVWLSEAFLRAVTWFSSLPFASVDLVVPNVLPWVLVAGTVAWSWLWQRRACPRCQCPVPRFSHA